MEAVKKASEGTDTAAIERALEGLTTAQHKAAESLYKQQASGSSGPGAPGGADSAGGGAAGGAGASGQQGDVIDAEVVDEGKS